METSLQLEPGRGLLLDAGCGDGIDLVNQAAREKVEVIGVDLSDGGVQASYNRTRHLCNAHVAQGDLCRLPFADSTFDLVYSYGVLHHLGVPELGIRELARVVKPGARVVAYLYEDFEGRSPLLRFGVRLATLLRKITTRIPPRPLYRLCQVAAPVVYLALAIPARILAKNPATRGIANAIPFRHGTGPFSLVGDLYDRLSAPVEYRYSRRGAEGLFLGAGLVDMSVAYDRGWMVVGRKPVG